jgi:tRNA-specific 2-thiouridylase
MPVLGEAVAVQVRAHGRPVPATVSGLGPAGDRTGAVQTAVGVVEVQLAEPLSGVAAGQTMALYSGSRVLGSATISATA